MAIAAANLHIIFFFFFRTFTKEKIESIQNQFQLQFSIDRNFWTGCLGSTHSFLFNLTLGFWQLACWIAFYQHSPLKKMFFNLLVSNWDPCIQNFNYISIIFLSLHDVVGQSLINFYIALMNENLSIFKQFWYGT